MHLFSNFNGNFPNPEGTIEITYMASNDYLQAAILGAKEAISKPPPEVRWIPTSSPSIKINCDGAYSSSRRKVAFGIIARDSGGLAQFWKVGE